MNRVLFASFVMIVGFCCTAEAHKTWLLPSQTNLSGAEPWVTVDAAVSNDLFYFNHFPLRLDNLKITAPDGQLVEGENRSTGRYRSVFDLPLRQDGTYRIAIVNHSLMASWEEGGERRRWRGSPAAFVQEVPAGASSLRVTESVSRVETFATKNSPNSAALVSTGKGIELVPVTHPNDLYSGEEATFRLVVEGAPKAGLEIEIIPGGTRYRNQQNVMNAVTNEKGEFSVVWPTPGMYWLSTSSSDDQTSIPQAQSRRLGYTVTLEVLPE